MGAMIKATRDAIVEYIQQDAQATDAFVQDVNTLLSCTSPSHFAPEQQELLRSIKHKINIYLGLA